MESHTFTRQNQAIETRTKAFNFKTTRVQVPESSIIQAQVSNGKYSFYNSKRSFCHQQFRTGSTNKDCKSRACASNNNKIIYKRRSKSTISRKTTLLHNSLRKIFAKLRNIINCKGEGNQIFKSLISGENAKLDKYVKITIFISETRNFGNAGERTYSKSIHPVINLKNLNKFIPYRSISKWKVCIV